MRVRLFSKKNTFIVGIIFFLLVYYIKPLVNKYVIFPVFHLSLFHGPMGWIIYSGTNLVFLYFLIQKYSQRYSIFEIPKFKALLITSIGLFLQLLLIKSMSQLLLVTSNQSAINSTLTNESLVSIYIQLFELTLIGPLLEELIFRGLLIEKDGSKTILFLSLLFSSLLFGIGHMAHGYSTFPFIYYTLTGINFSLVYWLTGKLQYSIFLHITLNVLANWEALTIYFRL